MLQTDVHGPGARANGRHVKRHCDPSMSSQRATTMYGWSTEQVFDCDGLLPEVMEQA
jgi:hypothetical protein